jgi:hypothetical protein
MPGMTVVVEGRDQEVLQQVAGDPLPGACPGGESWAIKYARTIFASPLPHWLPCAPQLPSRGKDCFFCYATRRRVVFMPQPALDLEKVAFHDGK